MDKLTAWIYFIEAIKLTIFLFLWLHCGIAFWTLVAWGLGIGIVMVVIVATIFLVMEMKRKKKQEGLQ